MKERIIWPIQIWLWTGRQWIEQKLSFPLKKKTEKTKKISLIVLHQRSSQGCQINQKDSQSEQNKCYRSLLSVIVLYGCTEEVMKASSDESNYGSLN